MGFPDLIVIFFYILYYITELSIVLPMSTSNMKLYDAKTVFVCSSLLGNMSPAVVTRPNKARH